MAYSGHMETNEISAHQVSLFRFLQKTSDWFSSTEASKQTGVARRTARAHLLKWSRAGIVDTAEVFPGHRYKLSPLAGKRNRELMQRLAQAADVFKTPD